MCLHTLLCPAFQATPWQVLPQYLAAPQPVHVDPSRISPTLPSAVQPGLLQHSFAGNSVTRAAPASRVATAVSRLMAVCSSCCSCAPHPAFGTTCRRTLIS
jgi:hypothetical protein